MNQGAFWILGQGWGGRWERAGRETLKVHTPLKKISRVTLVCTCLGLGRSAQGCPQAPLPCLKSGSAPVDGMLS